MTDHRLPAFALRLLRRARLITGMLCLLAASAQAGEGPGGVGGCVCWLSAKDLPRGALAVWPDLSKSGNDFKQDDAAKQPAVVENEKTKVKAVRFGGQQILSLGKDRFADKVGLNAVKEEAFQVLILFTIFPGGQGFLLTRGGTDNLKRNFWTVYYDNELVVGARGGKAVMKGFELGRTTLLETIWNGTTMEARMNGRMATVKLGGKPVEPEPLVLLGDLPGNPTPVPLVGLIFELMVFDHPLSSEETGKVRDYLKTTYTALAIPGL